jgi:N-acetylglutamate synthase
MEWVMEKTLAEVDAQAIADIERATLAAVAPESMVQQGAWLLPLDSGSVGRAKSAVPWQHTGDAADPRWLDIIEAYYAERGQRAALRMPDVPIFAALRAALLRKGYSAYQPSLVQTSTVQAMRAVADNLSLAHTVHLSETTDARWFCTQLNEGLDAQDEASRVARMGRVAGMQFAGVYDADHTLAVGAALYSHGWGSVHGLRTALSHRGQGLAAQVLAALANALAQQGCERIFLQVEEGNASALALYQRAGFCTAWRYQYWRLPVLPNGKLESC